MRNLKASHIPFKYLFLGWITLIVFFLCVDLFAQPTLALFKKDNIITRYEEGEVIRFKKKGDAEFSKGYIQGIHPGFIIVADDTLFVYDIERIDIRKKSLANFKVSSIGKGLIIAGFTLFAIDIINQTLVIDKTYSMDESVLRAGLILIGTGGFMQVVNNDYFKVRGKNKVATLIL